MTFRLVCMCVFVFIINVRNILTIGFAVSCVKTSNEFGEGENKQTRLKSVYFQSFSVTRGAIYLPPPPVRFKIVPENERRYIIFFILNIYVTKLNLVC